MAIRDDLNGLVDGLRRDIVDEAFGLRLDTVVVRTTTWSGTEIGLGTASHSDVTLDPVPKVRRPTPQLIAAAPGVYESGDVLCSKISAANYDEDDLSDQELPANTERVWLVNGKPYRPFRVEERYLEWRVHLRRMRDR